MQRARRFALILFELALLTTLIVATRCANYQDVFVDGNVYFVDADCYARMTRVQMVRAQPGVIIRHHAFENFPQGTTPHTTAPLDYLIIALSLLLQHFTAQPLELAGALVSPLLALLGGWFLWWWSRRMRFRYRWVLLILYAISPILVHGTELGRPDHQSLLILLVAIGICAAWSLQDLQESTSPSKSNRDGRPSFADATAGKLETAARCLRRGAWAIVSAVCWALAVWASAYEPVVLFVLMLVILLTLERKDAPHSSAATAKSRCAGWILFAAIIAIAFAVERRVPSFAIFQANTVFHGWAGTIGEMRHVSPANPAWLRWCGYLLLMTPILIWMSVRTLKDGAQGLRALPIYALLIATYCLTIWEVRWGYFFVLIFSLALPALLAPIKSGVAVWIAFGLSTFPILRDWDERLWPNEEQLASRVEKRIESAQIRNLALSVRSAEPHPFLAPWWLSPSIAYWSGQPGVAGSSHESLDGIEDSARFFLSDNLQQEREILQKRHVAWVFAYDSDRVAQNSASILNEAIPPRPLCRVLDRTPSQAPAFLIFSAQNPTCKLYRVTLE